MQLFRAVSPDELVDLRRSGRLQTAVGTLEGKWFAESPEDASAWGQILHDRGRFHVIVVEIRPSVAASLFRLERLDNIGPARFADMDDLPQLSFIGVIQ